MTSEKKRTFVEIYGQQYTIIGDESNEQVRHVANIIDGKMRKLSEMAPTMNATSIAVLTAINITNDSLNQQRKIEQLEQEIAFLKSELPF